jgi:hypothetical protein
VISPDLLEHRPWCHPGSVFVPIDLPPVSWTALPVTGTAGV